MKFLPYFKNRIKRAWRVRFSREKAFEIEELPLITPERLYRECRYIVDSEDPCDEHCEIYYFREDVREKTDEVLARLDIPYPGHEEYSINNGGMRVAFRGKMIPYEDFLNHPKLLYALEKFLHTPFLVMLYDLDTERKEYLGWYKTRIATLKDTADDWTGKPFADAVLKELERIGEELRKFCREAMETITVLAREFMKKYILIQQTQDYFTSYEILNAIKTTYEATQEKVRRANITLRHVKNAFEGISIHQVTHLQRAQEKLLPLKVLPFRT